MKRDFEGGRWIVELRPQGISHYTGAAVLALWLAAWAVGTAFGGSLVLSLLGYWPERSPLLSLPKFLTSVPEGFGLVTLGFMLVWLGVWTFGGIVALSHFLGLLWGVDQIEFDGAGVRHTRRIGPFGRSFWYPRENVRAATLLGREGMLVIETDRETIPLSRLGSRAERARVRGEIDKAMGLGQVQWFPELIEGWESEAITGGTVLRRNRTQRAQQAQVLWTITALAAGAVAWAQFGSGQEVVRWLVSSIGGLFGMASLVGALWLSWFLDEFHLKPGQAERHQRLGPLGWKRAFVPAHLGIEQRTDREGDDRYLLLLQGADGTTCVDQCLGEPGDLIRLGRWMAGKVGGRLDLASELKPSEAA